MKALKLENSIPAQDGLIILENSLALKCQDNRRSSFCRPRQQTSLFPDAITNIIEEKGSLPEQVFNADEMPYSGKKLLQRTFVSKEGRKAGIRIESMKGYTNSTVLCKCNWDYHQDCPYLQTC